MYAVIETGGKQYRVSPGELVHVEKLPVSAEQDVIFEKVLLIQKDGETIVGTPLIQGAQVNGIVMDAVTKAPKVLIFKRKRRKGYRLKRGHRQQLTQVRIKDIQVP